MQANPLADLNDTVYTIRVSAARRIIDAADEFVALGYDRETAFELACEKVAGVAPQSYTLAGKIWSRM